MADGGKLRVKIPLSWKKSSSMGVVIPHKMRNCYKWSKDILCDGCDELVDQNEEFSENLNESKKQAPDEFCHMLPWYKQFECLMIKDVMKVILKVNLGDEDYIFMVMSKNSYEIKTKPIGICIDIPIVSSKPIESSFH